MGPEDNITYISLIEEPESEESTRRYMYLIGVNKIDRGQIFDQDKMNSIAPIPMIRK